MKETDLKEGMFFLVCDENVNALKVVKSGILFENMGDHGEAHMVNVSNMDILRATSTFTKFCMTHGLGRKLVELITEEMLKS